MQANQYTKGVKVVACWQAKPNTTYIVEPVVKFYIATGAYQDGETVNLTEIGAKKLIDFTNQGDKTCASFDQLTDDSYTDVQYSYFPPFLDDHE